HIAFAGRIGNISGPSGIWSNRSGHLELVISTTDSLRGVRLNSADQIAFWRGTGLWSEGSGAMHLVAGAGDHAAGTPSGVNFSSFGFSTTPAFNDAGQTAFWARLSGTGVDSTNDTGIWSEGSGDLQLVARTCQHAPGTPTGVLFSTLRTLTGSQYMPALNNLG